jgi:hypothetical protein
MICHEEVFENSASHRAMAFAGLVEISGDQQALPKQLWLTEGAKTSSSDRHQHVEEEGQLFIGGA